MKKLILLFLLSFQAHAELNADMSVFFSYRCKPCEIMKQHLDTFAAKHQVDIHYIEVEQHPELCQQYRVTATPTLFVGEQKVEMKGLQSFQQLDQELLAMLAHLD
ncbi:thioredoxin family protein [Motilimonas pumila]|nr:thioredoxin family protein [Motilimonas pumila]